MTVWVSEGISIHRKKIKIKQERKKSKSIVLSIEREYYPRGRANRIINQNSASFPQCDFLRFLHSKQEVVNKSAKRKGCVNNIITNREEALLH